MSQPHESHHHEQPGAESFSEPATNVEVEK